MGVFQEKASFLGPSRYPCERVRPHDANCVRGEASAPLPEASGSVHSRRRPTPLPTPPNALVNALAKGNGRGFGPGCCAGVNPGGDAAPEDLPRRIRPRPNPPPFPDVQSEGAANLSRPFPSAALAPLPGVRAGLQRLASPADHTLRIGKAIDDPPADRRRVYITPRSNSISQRNVIFPFHLPPAHCQYPPPDRRESERSFLGGRLFPPLLSVLTLRSETACRILSSPSWMNGPDMRGCHCTNVGARGGDAPG
jgi:hypothetical protein